MTSQSPPGVARMTISFISADASFRRCLRVITRDGARTDGLTSVPESITEPDSSRLSVEEWWWDRGLGGSTEMVVAAVYIAEESISEESPR